LQHLGDSIASLSCKDRQLRTMKLPGFGILKSRYKAKFSPARHPQLEAG
jgi:hypothetical protein